MSNLIPILPGGTPIPLTPVAQSIPDGTIGGIWIASTIAIFFIFIVIAFAYFVITYAFGAPMRTAISAKGKSLIQHFNTPKSAIFKLAALSGGAFRYQNVRDGTVSALPDSVHNTEGAQVVLTYAQFGVTIPAKIMGAISILVSHGINNINELQDKYCTNTTQYAKDEKGQQLFIDDTDIPMVVNKTVINNDELLLTGYNFENFTILTEQAKEDRLVPLVIEVVQDFTNTNENADINENNLVLRTEIQALDNKTSSIDPHLMMCALILVIMIVGFVVVK